MKYLKSFKMVDLIMINLYFIVLFTTFKRIRIFHDCYKKKYFYEKMKKCRKMSSLIIGWSVKIQVTKHIANNKGEFKTQ